MKITLFYVKGEFNPVYLFAKCLREYLGLEIELKPCKFSWSAAGSLPLLQIGNYFIGTLDIIPVLSTLSGIDSDLSSPGQLQNKLITDLCLYKIHPNTQRASSCLSIYSKLSLSTSDAIKRFWKSPLKSVFSLLAAKGDSKEYMRLFEEAEENHRMLSEILDMGNFFCDKFGGESRVRSSDFIVYCYLKEEFEELGKEFHVTESLSKIGNLKRFLERIEDLVGEREGLRTDLRVDKELLEERAVRFGKCGKGLEACDERRKVVSVVSLGVLGYMLLNN